MRKKHDTENQHDLSMNIEMHLNTYEDKKEAEGESNSEKTYSLEQAMEMVGSHHRYQIYTFIFFGLQWIVSAIVLLSPIFIFQKPIFRCPLGPSTPGCHVWICNQSNPLKYIDFRPKSFIMQFNPPLICEREIIADSLSTIIYTGAIFGIICSKTIARKYGRQNALGFFWTLACIGSLLVSFSGKSIWATCIGFLLMSCVNPAIILHYAFMNQHSSGYFRDFTNSFIQALFGVGGVVLVFLAYMVQYWRNLVFFGITIPLIILLFGIIFLVEPPRYTYFQNDGSVLLSLKQIAEYNQIDLPMINLQPPEQSKEVYREFSFYDVFAYQSLNQITKSSLFLFFVIYVMYYGMNFILQDNKVGINIYANTLGVCTADIIAYTLAVFIVTKFQRKIIEIVFITLAALLFFIINKIEIPDYCVSINQQCDQRIWQYFCLILARFFLTSTQGIIYAHIAELFPMSIRSVGMHNSMLSGQIGSVMSSYVMTFCYQNSIPPMILLGLFGLSCSGIFFMLQETFNAPFDLDVKELQQQIKDVVNDDQNDNKTNSNNNQIYHDNQKEKPTDQEEDKNQEIEISQQQYSDFNEEKSTDIDSNDAIEVSNNYKKGIQNESNQQRGEIPDNSVICNQNKNMNTQIDLSDNLKEISIN